MMSALISFISGFFCWFGSVLANPGGFLNSFMNFLITASAVFFPTTPNSVKLSTFLANIASDNNLAAWFIHQILLAIAPLLIIYFTITIWKLLPFT